MQLQIEKPEANSITRYDEDGVEVGGKRYQQPLLLSANTKIALSRDTHMFGDLPNEAQAVLSKNEVLLIGSKAPRATLIKHWRLPDALCYQLGVEFMGIGPACRTYNVLLSEYRSVVVLLLFQG